MTWIRKIIGDSEGNIFDEDMVDIVSKGFKKIMYDLATHDKKKRDATKAKVSKSFDKVISITEKFTGNIKNFWEEIKYNMEDIREELESSNVDEGIKSNLKRKVRNEMHNKKNVIDDKFKKSFSDIINEIKEELEDSYENW